MGAKYLYKALTWSSADVAPAQRLIASGISATGSSIVKRKGERQD